jgi:hypothetical protein
MSAGVVLRCNVENRSLTFHFPRRVDCSPASKKNQVSYFDSQMPVVVLVTLSLMVPEPSWRASVLASLKLSLDHQFFFLESAAWVKMERSLHSLDLDSQPRHRPPVAQLSPSLRHSTHRYKTHSLA